MNKSENPDYIFKILVLGDTSVGKSSLITRFSDEKYNESTLPTIGVDFWDTAGQERFRSISSCVYRGAHGVIIVFDVTKTDTFNSIQNWLKEIEPFMDDNVQKTLVGNKVDLWVQRTVKYETAKEYADSLGLTYIETSAKTAKNVEHAFFTMAKELVNHSDHVSEVIEECSNAVIKIDSTPVQQSVCSPCWYLKWE